MMLRVGDVAVAPLPGGGFGACQVSGITAETVTIHTLAHVAASPPSLDDLRDTGPAHLDHHRWRGIAQVSILAETEAVPPNLDWIGNLPVPAGVPASCSVHSGWSSPLLQVALQRDWDRLPEATRAAYRPLTGGDLFTADLGAGPVTLETMLAHADLRPGAIPVPLDGPVDWSFLDRLPRCTQVSWSGPDRGLTAALTAHPMITAVHWSGAPAEIDLRPTAIRRAQVSGAAIRSIRLPAEAHALRWESSSECTVDARDDGRWLELTLVGATRAPQGLEQVRTVAVHGAGVLSAAALTGLSAAHTLRLHWSEPPGRLDDPECLTGLAGLRLITMTNAYGVPADALPALPLLRRLDIDGLPDSVAAGLRARFQGSEIALVLRGAKADEWLTANLDNPFRDWADDSAPAGAAACEAYATARRAIDGIREPDDAEPILRTLVETLNTIDEEYEIVDTIRREEAGDVFSALADRAGVPSATSGDWFDEWRDF